MDQLLKLIDALRERGAVKISTPEVSVEFALPATPFPATPEPDLPTFERPMDAAEIERLLYSETTKM
jgi:hypothetical protein